MPRCSCRVLQQFQDLRLHRDIQRRGRLVGDQYLRLAGQHHRNQRALALAAGKLERIGIELFTAQADRSSKRRLLPRRRATQAAMHRQRFVICSATVITGFRLVCGSWKIIARRPPRTSPISASVKARTGRHLVGQPHTAAATRPPSGNKRIKASAVSDLPQPDSPSKATHSLGRSRS
jgi:hypothetical protein